MNHIIFDLEMTMWHTSPMIDENGYMYIDEKENKKYFLDTTIQEIIQIGAVKLDKNFNTISSFKSFVKPKYNFCLTEVCKSFTKIKQSNIDNAPSLKKVTNDFIKWANEEKEKIKFYTWSGEDSRQLKKESKILELNLDEILFNCYDFQKIFSDTYNKHFNSTMNCLAVLRDMYGLKKVGDWLKISYDKNQLHDALADANLTSEIFKIYYTEGIKKYIA